MHWDRTKNNFLVSEPLTLPSLTREEGIEEKSFFVRSLSGLVAKKRMCRALDRLDISGASRHRMVGLPTQS